MNVVPEKILCQLVASVQPGDGAFQKCKDIAALKTRDIQLTTPEGQALQSIHRMSMSMLMSYEHGYSRCQKLVATAFNGVVPPIDFEHLTAAIHQGDQKILQGILISDVAQVAKSQNTPQAQEFLATLTPARERSEAKSRDTEVTYEK